MKFDTRKQKGKMGVAMAIAYFTSIGAAVSIPIDDTQDYDIIADINGILNKVQVKSSGSLSKYNSYCFDLRSTGGTNGKVYKNPVDLDCDSFFLFCENRDMFYFPKSELNGLNSVAVKSVRSDKKFGSDNPWIKFLVNI